MLLSTHDEQPEDEEELMGQGLEEGRAAKDSEVEEEDDEESVTNILYNSELGTGKLYIVFSVPPES